MLNAFESSVIGIWYCPKYGCEFNVHSDTLEKQQNGFEWEDNRPKCPRCGTMLEYEEEVI